MDIIGDREYVKVPGGQVHELPPLLLKESAGSGTSGLIMGLAEEIVQTESVIPEALEASWDDIEDSSRRYGIAVHLADQYVRFLRQWEWGESILEWIRQCETTFENRSDLRPLLSPDVWPNANRSSFVTLLHDKAVPSAGVQFEDAVGFRLTFRQPPPIDCFSDKFLMLLKSSIAREAYHSWADASSSASLPPERFHFLVMGTEIKEV